jgi:hypothetical protein
MQVDVLSVQHTFRHEKMYQAIALLKFAFPKRLRPAATPVVMNAPLHAARWNLTEFLSLFVQHALGGEIKRETEKAREREREHGPLEKPLDIGHFPAEDEVHRQRDGRNPHQGGEGEELNNHSCDSSGATSSDTCPHK